MLSARAAGKREPLSDVVQGPRLSHVECPAVCMLHGRNVITGGSPLELQADWIDTPAKAERGFDPPIVSCLEPLVKDGAIIQGGSFRLDRGPTATETRAFELAVALYDLCLWSGRAVKLCLIVNDLGLAPADRPKATGSFAFPAAYQQVLEERGISRDDVLLTYESSLRNRVKKDGKASRKNRATGIQVAVCANIMGRYYRTIAGLGFAQQVGFYAREPKREVGPEEKEDAACPLGPVLGTMEHRSGYALRLDVLNYSVLPSGEVRAMCNLAPEVADSQSTTAHS
jgi:hypothetical protein